jgi:hypothetical protein
MKDYLKIDRQDRNKFLTLMMKKCWHTEDHTEPYHDNQTIHICKCGARTRTPEGFSHTPTFSQDIDFSSPEGFFELWKFFKKASWFRECYHKMFESVRDNGCDSYTVDCLEDYIDPDKFADRIYMWHTRYR